MSLPKRRPRCEHMPQVDIRSLVRNGCLKPEAQSITVMDRSVVVERTPAYLGGTRAWFRCPNCNDRRAALYESNGILGCRRCLDLRYESEAEMPMQRAMRKRYKLEARLRRHASPYGCMTSALYTRLLERLTRLEAE